MKLKDISQEIKEEKYCYVTYRRYTLCDPSSKMNCLEIDCKKIRIKAQNIIGELLHLNKRYKEQKNMSQENEQTEVRKQTITEAIVPIELMIIALIIGIFIYEMDRVVSLLLSTGSAAL